MKKILVAFSYEKALTSNNYARFVKQLNKYAKNYRAYYTALRRLRYEIVSNQPTVFDTVNECDLADFDLVVFRTWEKEVERARAAAQYLSSKGVPFVDSETNAAAALTKLTQGFVLATAGLSVPDTLYTTHEDLQQYLARKNSAFKFPLIAKANNASKGRYNHLVNSAQELKHVLENQDPDDYREYMVQNFIPNDCDYRFLVFGDNVEVAIKRTRAAQASHLNNTSQGGQAALIDPGKFDRALVKDTIRAAQIMGREVAGVDVIFNQNTGEHAIIEVNRGPQLISGSETERKMSAFSNYLEELL